MMLSRNGLKLTKVEIYFSSRLYKVGTIVDIWLNDSDNLVRRLIVKVEETDTGYLYWLTKA